MSSMQLIDGQRPWGAVDVQSDRFGVTRHRLIVYPPGITAGQRRLLRLWRGWPVWGAVLWMLAEIALTQLIEPWYALATSTALALTAGAISWWLAGPLPRLVRIKSAAVLRGRDDEQARIAAGEIETLAHALAVADICLERGDITAVDHEMMWWQVYERLAPRRAAREAA